MSISNIKLFLFSAIVFLLSSCENYLDPGYDEYLSREEVFSSYKYALQNLRTVYNYLPGGDNNDIFMSDEGKSTDLRSSVIEMNNGAWTSRNYVGSWYWGHYYAGIRRAHIFLANVDQAIFIDENTMKATPQVNDYLRIQYKGEVKFLRAFYYFELLKRFGDPRQNLGVPILPEKVLTIEDAIDFKRNTYDECVNYILNDCDSAIKVLPARWTGTNYGRASAAAAMALKSRLLLYVASPLATADDPEKWKLAAEAAKQVIDLNAYKLIDKTTLVADSMLSIFTKPNNDEVIFSGPVTQSNSFEQSNLPPSYGGGGQINPSQNLAEAFETGTGYPISDPGSGYRVNEPTYRRDKRFEYFIGINGCRINKTGRIESYLTGKDGLDAKSTSTTKTGYYIRKFMDPNADIQNGRTLATHFWVHFRYAEILLNYAEAMAHAYGVMTVPAGYTLSAYDAIKMVRDRVSVSSTPLKSLSVDDFIERVKNERRVELCFEGHRFWDVRRWKDGEKYFNGELTGLKLTKNADKTYTYETFVVENRVFDEKMYVMPLPYFEIQNSKLLQQNTGW
ncbi:MAG TPA: RagB/SusD family nutrient uptake outer membrane protein [Paludibacter sp.]|nr:RagB/SusD family nutrient uptake outer membrane protein [Paludibacter sp.]